MSWLLRLAQSLPNNYISYTDIGHGYTRSSDGRRIQKWQYIKSRILWWYEDGKIIKQPCTMSTSCHVFSKPVVAQGRVDIDEKIGSVYFEEFETLNYQKIALRKRIIQMLVEEFPDISFYVFSPNPIGLQEYFDKLDNR